MNILYDCLRISRTWKFLYTVSDIWNWEMYGTLYSVNYILNCILV
jgi:hypothetical protein